MENREMKWTWNDGVKWTTEGTWKTPSQLDLASGHWLKGHRSVYRRAAGVGQRLSRSRSFDVRVHIFWSDVSRTNATALMVSDPKRKTSEPFLNPLDFYLSERKKWKTKIEFFWKFFWKCEWNAPIDLPIELQRMVARWRCLQGGERTKFLKKMAN